MGTLAAMTYQCGWVPQGEPSICIVPPAVQMKKGERKTYKVYVDVYVDGDRVDFPGFSCGRLSANTATPVVTGVYWSYGNEDGRFYYTFDYLGVHDVNTSVLFSVTYGGKVYACAVSLMSVADGAPGESIVGGTGPYCPPPQWWDQYPDGYEFQDGVTDTAGNPATRKDSVYWGIVDSDDEDGGKAIAYECIKSHKKGQLTNNLGNPVVDQPDKNLGINTATGGRAWRKGNSYHLVSTNVMLANYAYINLLSSNGIRIYNGARQIVGQMSSVSGAPSNNSVFLPFFIGGVMEEDGTFSNETGPLFGIDTEGCAYFGGTSGQRIKLDPVGKRMEVYGSDGKLCAVHSGDTIDHGGVESSLGSDSVTIDSSKFSKRLEGSTTETVTLASGTAGGDGTLTVKVPAITAVSDMTGYKGGNAAEMYLKVTVDGKTTSYFLGGATQSDASYVSPERTVSLGIAKNKAWKAERMFVSNLSGSASVMFSQSSTSQNGTAGVEVPNKLCHYGENGLIISLNSNNYAYCLLGSDNKMHVKIKCGGSVMFDTDTANKHF